MRVLCDFHHEDLYNSLRLLFEERLGFRLYRPVGVEWYREGFWMVHDAPDTAQQFLGIDELQAKSSVGAMQSRQPKGGHEWLNAYHTQVDDGEYLIPDRARLDTYHSGITLEKFKQTPFDIVLSSMPQHFDRYENLIRLYQPNARHIFQMGNHWPVPERCNNLLDSTTTPHRGGLNAVRYHQEFSLSEFNYTGVNTNKVIRSFLHYNGDHGRPDLMTLKDRLIMWQLEEWGAGNQYGPVPIGGMPRAIKSAGAVMHVKRGGDGYGYNLHQAAACGRPIIYRGSWLRGQTAEALLTHGETGVDLDRCPSIGYAALRIENAVEDGWGENMHKRFTEVVDFDREAEAIKVFIERLV